MIKPKITYPDKYNEALKPIEKTLAVSAELQAQDALKLLLLFLIEYSQMWYKTKCAAKNYCIEQYADVANGYAEGVEMINAKIIELFRKNNI